MIFEYQFFQNALLGSLLISLVCGIVGTYIVVRRLVFISGGITHASFGGLGLGFYLGLNPVFMAMLFAAGSALGVEWLSQKGKVREDSAIAVFWSLGMALGILFVFLTPGYTPGMSEFLFGNILTITTQDLWLFSIVAAIVVGLFTWGYRPILHLSFDREFMKTRGMNVRLWESGLLILVAITIVLSIRLVGIVLLMSLFTVPQMTAALFTKNFRTMMILSIIISTFASVGGLLLSYLINIPSGTVIILLLIGIYGIIKLFFLTFSSFKYRHQ